MKNKTIYAFFILAILNNIVYSQVIGHADSVTRAKARITVENCLTKPSQANYLLFSIADKWYLIIVRKRDKFYQYYIDSDTSKYRTNVIKRTTVLKENTVLLKAFDERLYGLNYITFNSPFYKVKHAESEGNLTYFYLKKNDIKYGEARLSVFINPNPINKEVYNYLVTTLLMCIKNNQPPPG